MWEAKVGGGRRHNHDTSRSRKSCGGRCSLSWVYFSPRGKAASAAVEGSACGSGSVSVCAPGRGPVPATRVGPCPVPCDMRADAVFVFGWRAPAPLALVCGVRGPARRGLWFLRLGVRVHGCLSCDARGRAGPDQATRRDVGCRCGVGWRRETEYENGVHNGKALLFLNFEITSGIPRGPR